jgi:hypothetical protein
MGAHVSLWWFEGTHRKERASISSHPPHCMRTCIAHARARVTHVWPLTSCPSPWHPIIMGIAAALRGDLLHRASIRLLSVQVQLLSGQVDAADEEINALAAIEREPFLCIHYLTIFAQIRLAQGRAAEASELALGWPLACQTTRSRPVLRETLQRCGRRTHACGATTIDGALARRAPCRRHYLRRSRRGRRIERRRRVRRASACC